MAGKSFAHGTSVEARFKQLATGKGWRTLRSGWPDFLVVRDGVKPRFVEVKSSTDTLSDNQVELYEALGKAGIPVYVWWELTPGRLIPWRRFYAMQTRLKKGRHRAIAYERRHRVKPA